MPELLAHTRRASRCHVRANFSGPAGFVSPMSPRPPVAALVAWIVFLACAPPPAASLPAPAPAATAATAHRPAADAYDLVQVAPRVYVFVAKDSRSPIVSGNSTAIVGDDAVMVVDTGQFPALARRMIADLRRITPKPVKVVVNTHWHNDHVFGNAVYRDAFPGVRFVAHEETKRLLLKNGPKQVEAYRTKIAPFVASLKEELRAGKAADGGAMTSDARGDLEEKIADGEAAVALWRDVELAAPTETFKDDLVVPLGGCDVRVMHLGRGNTAGDAIVYVPEGKVLVTGDIVVAPTPFAGGSYPREWRAVLAKLAATDATTLVPGHGPVQRDRAYVRDLEALLAAVDAQVAAAAKDGRSLDEARKSVDLGPLGRKFTGGDAYRARVFHEYFEVPAVDRAFEEATGHLSDE
jgi:cyclase